MEITKNELKEIITSAVDYALERRGEKPSISHRQAVVLFGAEFNRAVESGQIKPISIGKGKNGMRRYSVAEIEMLHAFNKREARLQLESM